MLFTRRRLMRSLQLFLWKRARAAHGERLPWTRSFPGITGLAPSELQHDTQRFSCLSIPSLFTLLFLLLSKLYTFFFFSFMDPNARVKRSPKENVWFVAVPPPHHPLLYSLLYWNFAGFACGRQIPDDSPDQQSSSRQPGYPTECREYSGGSGMCALIARAHTLAPKWEFGFPDD